MGVRDRTVITLKLRLPTCAIFFLVTNLKCNLLPKTIADVTNADKRSHTRHTKAE